MKASGSHRATSRTGEPGIVPWLCHICGCHFDTLGGGLCTRCQKETCAHHLVPLPGAKKKLLSVGGSWVCVECLTESERAAHSVK